MADIRFNCEKCGQKLKVDAEGAGLKISCPSCGQVVVVPPLEAGPPATTPQPQPSAPQPAGAQPAPVVLVPVAPAPPSGAPGTSVPRARVAGSTPVAILPVSKPKMPTVVPKIVPPITPTVKPVRPPVPVMNPAEIAAAVRASKRNAFIFWAVALAGMVGLSVLLLVLGGTLPSAVKFTLVIVPMVWTGTWGWLGQRSWTKAANLELEQRMRDGKKR